MQAEFSHLTLKHQSQCPQCVESSAAWQNKTNQHSKTGFFEQLAQAWRFDPYQEQIPRVDQQSAEFIKLLLKQKILSYAPKRTIEGHESRDTFCHILELGVGGGFSSSYLMQAWYEALAPKNFIYQGIEYNPDRLAWAQNQARQVLLNLQLERALDSLETQWVWQQGEALHFLNALSDEPHFDFVFVDAMKKRYLDYWKLLAPRIKEQGLIIFDNVFLSGRTFHRELASDIKTHRTAQFSMGQFLESLTQNSETGSWQLFSVGDGLLVFQKDFGSIN